MNLKALMSILIFNSPEFGGFDSLMREGNTD